MKQPTSAKLPPYRPGKHSVRARGGSGWWGDVDLQNVPDLAGYVETRDRPGAEVLLETSEAGHPVLGSWRYGLGRVTAFTSEPTGPGTEPWRDWDGYGPWLARLLQRTASDQRADYGFTLERNREQLTLVARRRRPEAPALRVSLVDENGELAESLPLQERAPGVFRARWHAPMTQEVRVVAECGEGEGLHRTRLVSSLSDELSAEDQVDPLRTLDLRALSAATSGVVIEPGELAGFEPPASIGLRPRSLQMLWPWFRARLSARLPLRDLRSPPRTGTSRLMMKLFTTAALVLCLNAPEAEAQARVQAVRTVPAARATSAASAPGRVVQPPQEEPEVEDFSAEPEDIEPASLIPWLDSEQLDVDALYIQTCIDQARFSRCWTPSRLSTAMRSTPKRVNGMRAGFAACCCDARDPSTKRRS